MSNTRRNGLAALHEVKLDPRLESMLDAAARTAGGTLDWRARKKSEVHDLFALCQLAPHRLAVERVSLAQDIHADLRMRVPVATRREPNGDMEVADEARLSLVYPREALYTPVPGAAFVTIREPLGAWYPQVPVGPVQLLCLGETLPANIPLREIVLLSYGALTMQTIQIDERDPGGVFNSEAALWWQANTHRIPLSDEPFLGVPEAAA